MPAASAEEGGGGDGRVADASERVSLRQIDRTDYRALHRGKPSTEASSRPAKPRKLTKETTLDDIVDLLEAISDQNKRLTIQCTRNEDQIKSLTEKLQQSQEAREQLTEQVSELKKEISELIEITRGSTASQPQSSTTYASVLRGDSPPNQVGRGALPNATAVPTATPAKAAHIELDLTNVEFDITKAGDIRARFHEALKSQETTKNSKCWGLTRSPSEPTKVRFLFCCERDEEEVRANTGWLDNAFRGARMRGPQWYPVKVDDINKTAVFNEERTALRTDAHWVVGEENRVGVMQARWLSRASGRLYGSAVLQHPTSFLFQLLSCMHLGNFSS